MFSLPKLLPVNIFPKIGKFVDLYEQQTNNGESHSNNTNKNISNKGACQLLAGEPKKRLSPYIFSIIVSNKLKWFQNIS